MSPNRSIPLNEIPPGSTLFVASTAVNTARNLALTLLLAGSTAEDQLLLTTTETPSDALLAQCERLYPTIDFTDIHVIDCTESTSEDADVAAHVETLESPGDLTGLGIKFSVMTETLSHASSTRVLSGVVTVSPLLQQADLRAVTRFLQTATGRIEGTAGVGLFVIDPNEHDDRTVSTLREVCDGWIEVRDPADTTAELRVSDIPNQPEEWTPFTLPE